MFNRILIAVDLELETAQALLTRGIELNPGETWVVHVVESQTIQYSIDPTFTGSITQAMEDDSVRQARSRVSEICAPFGIPEDRQLIVLGRTADEIHQAARENDTDTIVIGSHAGTGLRRLLGSTANAVLHGSPVNVMTLRMDTT